MTNLLWYWAVNRDGSARATAMFNLQPFMGAFFGLALLGDRVVVLQWIGGAVTVGDYAWLSFRCVVLPGVTIGEGAVVAAGAVVTADVEPYTIVGGIPARRIGDRARGLTYDLASQSHLAFV